jgi:hypothetical protein
VIWGSNPGISRVIFLFSRKYRAVLEPKPPSVKWVPWLFPWGKRLGFKVDHSPPSGCEVKKEWSCTSTAPPCLRDVGEDNLIVSHLDRHTRIGRLKRTVNL